MVHQKFKIEEQTYKNLEELIYSNESPVGIDVKKDPYLNSSEIA